MSDLDAHLEALGALHPRRIDLSLTRIELNEHVRPEAKVALAPIVRQAAAALAPLAAADGITITIHDAANLPEIRAIVPMADGTVYAVALGGSTAKRTQAGPPIF